MEHCIYADCQQQTRKHDEQGLIQNTLKALDLEVNRVNENISNLIRIETRAFALELEIKTKLQTLQIERQVIEQDELIQRYLELEEIDLDRLNKVQSTSSNKRKERLRNKFYIYSSPKSFVR